MDKLIAWKNINGQWLTYRSWRSHTGDHSEKGFTSDILEAYVAYYLPYEIRYDDDLLIAVEVEVVRTVTVVQS